jgi:uncharacterized protein YggE
MNKKLYSALALAAVVAVTVLMMNTQSAFSQIAESSSIKVTGDASLKADPDQAVMIVGVQTEPSEITIAVGEQKSKTNGVVKELRTILGNDDTSSVAVGQMTLNPIYGGTPSYSGISTFTIYSSTAIDTNIENFSDIVRKLSEAGFGFEGVYATPAMYSVGQESLREAGSGEPAASPEDITKQKQNTITLNVSLNTKPGKLDDVLTEYDEKYKKLVSILEESGISADQIKPANVNINPFYYGPSQSSTYQTYSQVIVRTSVNNIEKVTEAAKKQDAYVENTFLSISDSSIEKLREKLNKQAFDNAKSRADAMAKIAGMKVGAVKNIESTSSIVNPYGGYQSYKGLYVIPPYYYQSISGEIASSITVEFELVK